MLAWDFDILAHWVFEFDTAALVAFFVDDTL